MRKAYLILLLMLLVIVKCRGQSDFEALLELKKGFEGTPSAQNVLVSWDPNSLSGDGCPQNWFGVECIDGNVTSISLDNVGLVGNFSFPAIAGLNMLRNLTVSNNQLTGTLSNVVSINSLEFLDLSRNSFHGFLPPGLGSLENLVLLNLSHNNFEGLVWSGLGSLGGLEYIDFRGNSFSGDIMDLLSPLGSVVYVDLSSNSFSGSLDLGLGNSSFISSIQYLNISHNSLVGQLFAHDGMPYFDSLEVFDASNNQLVGRISPFNFVVSLRILWLGNNQLSGSLPEALLEESSMVLSDLDLSLNQLEGPVGSITSATLRKLNISSNKISGPLPISVGHCAIIDLSNNMLSGTLSRIQAWGNYVEVIQLSWNSLTGTFPNQTSQFLRLHSLNLSNNSLNGDLPAVLGTYSELQVIDLSRNFFTGLLLPDFFTSSTLTDLNLSSNNFTGQIPLQEMQGSSQNSSLVSLDLSHNFLDGNLPSGISGLHNLQFLDLSNNNLNGSIPDVFSSMLKSFNVSSNNLSGVVPDNLLRFPDSAFHPGNSLLIFQNSPFAPNSAPGLTLREDRSQMRPSVRIAMIVAIVFVAMIITSICIMLLYKKWWQKKVEELPKVGKGSKAVPEASSAVPRTSETGPRHDLGGTSKDHETSAEKDEGLSSPLSVLTSSNPSPCKSQLSYCDQGVHLENSPNKLTGDLYLFDGSITFTAEELSHAPAEVIGTSCHGTLYKATLDSGNVVAIKWLKEGIAKGRKEFAREAKKLGSIGHPNLVPLQGYYWGPKDHERMLISSYIDAQCLAFYIQEPEPRKMTYLSLEERERVAVNVARCLNYLHSERAIPHGNLKSTNILLQPPSMDPLLTDYSLHRILTSAGTSEQVLTAAALGYGPPEFASSTKPCPSLKSDVYALGVILIELITGKNPGEMVSMEPGFVELTEWVRLLAEQNHASDCFDKLLFNRTNPEAPVVLNQMLRIALRCILPASERPDMKSVFEDLSSLLPLESNESYP